MSCSDLTFPFRLIGFLRLKKDTGFSKAGIEVFGLGTFYLKV